MLINNIKQHVINYLETLSTQDVGRYRNCRNGHITLYASCFAVMIFHYLDAMDKFSETDLKQWANYILDYQKKDGLFWGPEIIEGTLLSDAHSKEHLAWHLTCHVLPALSILGEKPRRPLSFIEQYFDSSILIDWLENRNWQEAWLEGNNLLFMGQLLTFLAVEEGDERAKQGVKILLKWLDKKIDPNTGFWGTDGHCDIYKAVYGGYHQLLLYYYWQHPIMFKKVMIDTVLSLQHFDGGFVKGWGGGSCEDVDCVDILVNLYKLTDYRRIDIEYSLRKAVLAVIRRMAPCGGFVYKKGEEFYHMGMKYTYALPDEPNIFSTWFGIHTLLLISEIISLPCFEKSNYHFNNACSMGWHRKWDQPKVNFVNRNYVKLRTNDIVSKCYFSLRQIKRKSVLLTHAFQLIKKIKNFK